MIAGIEAIVAETSWATWVAMLLAVAAGAVFQVGIGVGFGSVTGPSAMLVAPHMMPATMSCLAFVTAMLGMARIQGRIAYNELAWALAGRVVGAAVAGVLLATLGSREGFALLFAGLTLAGVGMSLAQLRLPLNPASLVLAGGLSGLMATVTMIGGPPMALVYQNEALAKARPTMNAFFGIGMIPTLLALWGAGMLTGADGVRALVLLPATFAGIYSARLLSRFIDRRYRAILLAFCIAAAVIIALKALIRLAW